MTITTINLTEEDKVLIKQLNLSPTELIREKLADFKIIVSKNRNDTEQFEREIIHLEKKSESLVKFIRQKGLFDEYISWATN